ncbi:MAG TPA: hypothetical protein VL549_01210 [Gemmatimonadales bacterium]|nr:hypothetical protein [Gemmatimonadales bacterium]
MRRAAVVAMVLAGAACQHAERAESAKTSNGATPEFSASATGSTFPTRAMEELVALQDSISPTAWLRSHPQDTLQLYADAAGIDGGSGWCARAVRRSYPETPETVRYAYFYPPEPPPDYSLPSGESADLIRAHCRLGAIWIQTTAASPPASLVAMRVRDTLTLSLGAANTEFDRDMVFGGGAYWSELGWWRAGERTVVSAYDRSADDTHPRVLAVAFLPFSGAGKVPEGYGDSEREDATQRGDLAARAARLSQLDAAVVARLLNAAAHGDSVYRGASGRDDTPARAAARQILTALREWLTVSTGLARDRRAAALLAADQVLGGDAIPYLLAHDSTARDSLKALGAVFAADELGGGENYVHSWLDSTLALDAGGPAGRLANLALLRIGYNKSGMCGGTDSASQRVSAAAERMLQLGGDSDAAELHLLAAEGYADVVALAAGAGDDYADSMTYKAAAPEARTRAIAHYRQALALIDPAVRPRIWLAAWRLVVGLPPLRTRFFCVYD